MSSLYLIRHGQAGLRHRYDCLSDLGRRQGRLLGEYFVSQGLRFAATYSGALERQRQTAAAVCQAYAEAGIEVPDPVVDEGWNEFDLDAVYRELAPLLSAADPQFQADHQELLRLMRDESAPIHRTWTPCDATVVRAWIEAKYPCGAESWDAFRQRVSRALQRLATHSSGEKVAVFTSATPIAVCMGLALGLANGRVMKLAGVIYNSACTTLRSRGDEAALFSFNSVAHLPQPELRTFR